MKRFTIDLHGPLHGLDFGGEGPLVLLVHGLGGSSINWAAVGGDLTTHGHVMALDLPGFGRTPPAGRSAAIDDQASLVADFVEHVADRPAMVIGNSMGGLIAMLLAARRPDLVDRLVLVDPAAPSWSPTAVNRGWALMMGVYLLPGVNKVMFNALQRRGSPEQRTAVAMELIAANGSRVSDHMKRLHADVARERDHMPWVAEAFLEAYKSIAKRLAVPSRYYRIVHRIMAPTLLMHGMVDSIVPFSAAQRLASQRPDWTFVPLEDTGHVPQLEAGEKFLKVVAEFAGDHQQV